MYVPNFPLAVSEVNAICLSEVEVLANSEVGETMELAKLLERTTSIVSCKRVQTSRISPSHPKIIKFSIPLHIPQACAIFSSLHVPWC